MSKIKVGFIGVGLMGLPMVQNIAKNNITTLNALYENNKTYKS